MSAFLELGVVDCQLAPAGFWFGNALFSPPLPFALLDTQFRVKYSCFGPSSVRACNF